MPESSDQDERAQARGGVYQRLLADVRDLVFSSVELARRGVARQSRLAAVAAAAALLAVAITVIGLVLLLHGLATLLTWWIKLPGIGSVIVGGVIVAGIGLAAWAVVARACKGGAERSREQRQETDEDQQQAP